MQTGEERNARRDASVREGPAYITDLMSLGALELAIANGLVSRQPHPRGGMAIYNYTHRCQYERAWDDVTTQCRGLIVSAGGQVLARPWRKFFNYGELTDGKAVDASLGNSLVAVRGGGALDLDAPCEVLDKMDGSLGILYRHPVDGWSIATRGSFTSDQALRGTQLLREAEATGQVEYSRLQPALTYLFEIVYPENRIVLDYEGFEGLVLLGTVITKSGVPLGLHGPGWQGPQAQVMPASTLREALELEPRENAEGVVVRYIGGAGRMVKIKQEDYVALHRIVTGLNERTVWQMAADGMTYEEMVEPLPEEFHEWVRRTLSDLVVRASLIRQHAVDTFLGLQHATGDRKTFASYATEEDGLTRGLLFLMLDGKDDLVWPAIWRTLRPKGNRAPREFTEATA